MKNNLLKTSTLAAFLFAVLTSFVGSAKTGSSVFEINPVENLFLGKNIEKVWTITYSGKEKPLTIALQKIGKNLAYVVRSEFFEVIYSSDQEGFGVKQVSRANRTVNNRITSSILSKDELNRQRILTTNPVSEEYALGLIASYIPDLLNDGYEHLIY